MTERECASKLPLGVDRKSGNDNGVPSARAKSENFHESVEKHGNGKVKKAREREK